MLSYGYWRSRFGGAPSVIGRRILLDGNAFQVIGVLPRSFSFMDRRISMLAPLRFQRAAIRLIGFCCQGVGRLKPGITLAQANADIARVLPMAPAKFPMNPGFGKNVFTDARIAPRLRPLKEVLVGDSGNTLWMLMGTVGIVLLIACANVGNLFLVRAGGAARNSPRARRWVRASDASRGSCFWRARCSVSPAVPWDSGSPLPRCGLSWPRTWRTCRAARNSEWIHRCAMLTLAVSLAAGVLFGLIPVLPLRAAAFFHRTARRRPRPHRQQASARARAVRWWWSRWRWRWCCSWVPV